MKNIKNNYANIEDNKENNYYFKKEYDKDKCQKLLLPLENKIKRNEKKNFKIIINKTKRISNNKILFIIILIIINLPIFNCNAYFKIFKSLSYDSEIIITIIGDGDQYILTNSSYSNGKTTYDFKTLPSEIIVNGVIQNYTDRKVYNLTNQENIIIMKWTEQITDCSVMFLDLENITSIDLSNFDSSKVTKMYKMFQNCISLISINLNNLNTSLVTNFGNMFVNCHSLEFLDLSSFQLSSALYMDNMFFDCISLISINLTGFNTSSVVQMKNLFRNCKSLVSLDLRDFDTTSVTEMTEMFKNCQSLVSLNLNNFYTPSLEKIDEIFARCSSLIYLNINNFNTTKLKSMKKMFYGCSSLISINLFNFNISNETNISEMFGKINNNIVYCINEENHKIISYLEETNPNYINNCPNICFEESKNVKYTEDNTCLIDCTNDNIYKYDYNNICYKKCPNETHYSYKNNKYICELDPKCNLIDYFNNICRIKNNTFEKDRLLTNITYELENGLLDKIISDIIIKNHKDLIAHEYDIIYQITSSENQNNNDYINISTIKLGECESKLKKYYKINNDESLIILKIEYYKEGLLIPIIEYEVYHPITKKKLDLNICNDTKIELLIPTSIDEDNLFKYNLSSEYYNDICYPYTTEAGTDIILQDRRNEYIDNNMFLCEDNCEYKGYDFENKKVICICKPKIIFESISKLTINKDQFLNSFTDIKNILNVYVMKCYKLLFSKKGLNNNIGSYLLLSIIFINILLLVLFIHKGYNKIIEKVKSIKVTNKKEIKKENNIIIYHKLKKKKESQSVNQNLDNNKRKIKKLKIENVENLEDEKIFESSLSKIKIKQQNNINKIIEYNDHEINNFNYQDALRLDNRSFFQYYLSLLKRKQIIIFTFITTDDYNSKKIKISLFLFSFALFYFVNALFFDDKTMHKIYKDEGSFDFVYQLPKILYSTIISVIINTSVKYLSLTENNILEIKKIKNEEDNIDEKKAKIVKCLNFKLIFFFILNFFFLILFWYYLGCFCAVYANTQMHLIKDSLISFGLSLLYPFCLNLIPGIFRIPAIKTEKKDQKCIYVISKIIQKII